MIDINYIEKELNEIDTTTLTSLYFWCEILITRVRALEKENTTLQCNLHFAKTKIKDLGGEND